LIRWRGESWARLEGKRRRSEKRMRGEFFELGGELHEHSGWAGEEGSNGVEPLLPIGDAEGK